MKEFTLLTATEGGKETRRKKKSKSKREKSAEASAEHSDVRRDIRRIIEEHIAFVAVLLSTPSVVRALKW